MGCYDFSNLIDLSWTKNLATIPDRFVHDSCLTHRESERKLFLTPRYRGITTQEKFFLTKINDYDTSVNQ